MAFGETNIKSVVICMYFLCKILENVYRKKDKFLQGYIYSQNNSRNANESSYDVGKEYVKRKFFWVDYIHKIVI